MADRRGLRNGPTDTAVLTPDEARSTVIPERQLQLSLRRVVTVGCHASGSPRESGPELFD
jgi:hypothetical protein